MRIDKIAIESEFEREALDMIDTAPKQIESLAKGDVAEWDCDSLPPIGVECSFTPDNTMWGFNYIEEFTGTVLHYEGEQFVFMLNHDKYKLDSGMIIVSRTDKGEFSKPESPEQQAERERLEASYDLYCTHCEAISLPAHQFSDWVEMPIISEPWIRIVDKTGYRKEQK